MLIHRDGWRYSGRVPEFFTGQAGCFCCALPPPPPGVAQSYYGVKLPCCDQYWPYTLTATVSNLNTPGHCDQFPKTVTLNWNPVSAGDIRWRSAPFDADVGVTPDSQMYIDVYVGYDPIGITPYSPICIIGSYKGVGGPSGCTTGVGAAYSRAPNGSCEPVYKTLGSVAGDPMASCCGGNFLSQLQIIVTE